ncbi:hypothetical protein F5Y17DRAFT_118272 [Xylariaceae sp. FL0594]|nr:hypothetical protein F5Y17DRAFT_118272 [Xylariaceae sp. FL0594]
MPAQVPVQKSQETERDSSNSSNRIQTERGGLASATGGGEATGAPLSSCPPSETIIVPVPVPASASSASADAALLHATTTDDAIDDSEDLPDEFVQIQKTLSGERRLQQNNRPKLGIQDLLPFPFSPLIRPLTVSDVESCVALENAAFANPAHRCTREKFEYRLTACPELSMGVFCTVVPAIAQTQGWEIETLKTAHPVETDRGDGALSVLLAHIVATRTHEVVVTDGAMDYPRDFKTARSSSSSSSSSANPQSDGQQQPAVPVVGHEENGRTICIHSLAVHPKLQGVGMGRLIVKAYMQQAKNSNLASRIALICQEYLINYYKRFGFVHVNPSDAAFSGGGWHDMVST